MAIFINLTPHAINLITDDFSQTFAPSGKVARVAQVPVPAQDILIPGEDIKVPTIRMEYGQVEGLPEKVENTYLIVSGQAQAAAPEQKNLLSSGEQFRDSEGRVIGCKNFKRS